MLSRNLEQTLHRALSLASERRHEYATLEHLLLGLADDSDAATVLRACGVDPDKLRQDLGEFLDKDLSGLATDRAGGVRGRGRGRGRRGREGREGGGDERNGRDHDEPFRRSMVMEIRSRDCLMTWRSAS